MKNEHQTTENTSTHPSNQMLGEDSLRPKSATTESEAESIEALEETGSGTRLDPHHGGEWSEGQVSIDNQKSPSVGINLARDMAMSGIPEFKKGDILIIEVLKDGRVQRFSGRASRKRTAYFSRVELQSIGIRVHDTVIYSILSVNLKPTAHKGSDDYEDMNPNGPPNHTSAEEIKAQTPTPRTPEDEQARDMTALEQLAATHDISVGEALAEKLHRLFTQLSDNEEGAFITHLYIQHNDTMEMITKIAEETADDYEEGRL